MTTEEERKIPEDCISIVVNRCSAEDEPVPFAVFVSRKTEFAKALVLHCNANGLDMGGGRKILNIPISFEMEDQLEAAEKRARAKQRKLFPSEVNFKQTPISVARAFCYNGENDGSVNWRKRPWRETFQYFLLRVEQGESFIERRLQTDLSVLGDSLVAIVSDLGCG
jgi:hypothetical protein